MKKPYFTIIIIIVLVGCPLVNPLLERVMLRDEFRTGREEEVDLKLRKCGFGELTKTSWVERRSKEEEIFWNWVDVSCAVSIGKA